MKVKIELDLDIYSTDNEDLIHDLIADWTYDMRTTKRLVPGSWKINYNVNQD